MAVFITGDIHADPFRLSSSNFPIGKHLTREDYVIICGDFGCVWSLDSRDDINLNWLAKKPFTVLFVDGNHENFDKLYQYPEKDWHGGRVHELRPNVLHLMRGYVFDIQGHSFFCMGGAMSHDIDNGVVIEGNRHQHTATVLKRVRNPFGDKYEDAFVESEITNYIPSRIFFRHLGLSWWLQELPTREEIKRAEESLAKVNNTVDFVITHDCPGIATYQLGQHPDPSYLVQFFDSLFVNLKFKHWYFGHHHEDKDVFMNIHAMFESIVQVL